MAQIIDWVKTLSQTLPEYLNHLKQPGQAGRFFPCVEGQIDIGRQISLGFSCFALKIYYTIGLWEQLPKKKQEAWSNFIQHFQVDNADHKDRFFHYAFIDFPEIRYLARNVPWREYLSRILFSQKMTHVQRVIIAETKQAIASLAQVGAASKWPYRGFPQTPEEIETHLLLLDWSNPWGAGGQASALTVFLRTEAPRFLNPTKTQALLDTCATFFESIADQQTGAYFKGKTPERYKLINGAMKVLTALDWLEVPIHYPNALIDSCLDNLPSSEGCHLVDWVYVLYRCAQQTEYKRSTIQMYCTQVLEMIQQHHKPDGGFSYFIRQSQTGYYGVPISQGLNESDIHGTCLLTWAVSMILELLEENSINWRVIKP